MLLVTTGALEPWQPADCVLMAKLMNFFLTYDQQYEIIRSVALNLVGGDFDKVEEIVPINFSKLKKGT